MSKFIITRNNGKALLGTEFHLTPGNTLTLKIDGLNLTTRKHLKFLPENGVVSIFQNDNPQRREQTLQITARSIGRSIVKAVDTNIDFCPNFAQGVAEDCFPPLTIHVLPKISIPTDLNDEQRAMLMVLLAETSSPDSKKFKYNEKEAKDTMQYMHDVLLNRVRSPKAKYLGVP
ncbi:hypothetical protein, partial [Xenorhabdus innexi]